MMDNLTLVGEALKRRVRSAGAVAVGFAAAEPVSDDTMAAFDRWIASGSHAGMKYMEAHREIRRDPRLLLDGAETIISMAFCYRPADGADNPYIARYALLPDYHDYIRERLRRADLGPLLGVEGKDWRICIDSAPLMERYWARRAGIGLIGENGALIVPGVGPEVFLAEIVTNLRLDPDEPTEGSCRGCGKCREACPGGALKEGRIDCDRCLSYITIEHRGDFTDPRHLATLASPEGRQTLFGCDRCVRVCPHNNPAVTSDIVPADALLGLTPEKALALTPEDFSRQFRGTAVKRAKLAGLRRNALHISTRSED